MFVLQEMPLPFPKHISISFRHTFHVLVNYSVFRVIFFLNSSLLSSNEIHRLYMRLSPKHPLPGSGFETMFIIIEYSVVLINYFYWSK